MRFQDVKNWTDHLKWTLETKGIDAAKALAERGGDTWPPTPYQPKPRKFRSLPTSRRSYVAIVGAMIEESSKTGYIYFVRSAGKVKIGYSVSPHARHKNLRTMMPDDSKLIGWFSGSQALEKGLHKLFEPLRVRDNQEWFYITDALRKVIKAYATLNLDEEVERARAERLGRPSHNFVLD